MESTATSFPRAQTLSHALRFDRRAAGAWILGFAPVLYLALRGGGYDLVVRSEVFLAAWWVVLVGVLAGTLPLNRIGRLGWTCLGLLGGFVVWSLIGVSWSSSAERTVTEVARLSGYLGFLALGLCVVRRDTARALVNGMAVAFGAVAGLAVLSRLYPAAFPANGVLAFFPGSNARLNYPLNYANGDGEFLALGIPLLLGLATRARTIAGQALGAALIPVSALGVVMCASRGGVLTGIVGVAIFYALSQARLPKLATGLTTAAGAGILIGGLVHRAALRNGLATPTAVSQRHAMVLLVLFTCAGVALVQTAIGLASRYALAPRAQQVSRTTAVRATAVAVVLALVVALAAGLPHEISHQWDSFKQTSASATSTNVLSRLGTAAGSHRYQYWQAALHAFNHKPLTGIGPGTFEFYWSQRGSLYEFVRNAHSLYLETMAEAGLPGLLLIVGLLGTVLLTGIVRALRAPPLTRSTLATATAAFAAFCAAAAFDWVWQLAVMPVAMLLLAAVIVVPRRTPARAAAVRPPVAWATRIVPAIVALAAIVVIAIPLGATSALRSSQSEAAAHHLSAALADATTAQHLQPYAASPRLQRALLLERLGDLPGARTALAQATTREPTDWRLWLVGARIQAESGRATAAIQDFRRAHALNPLSPTTAIHG